ncbi:MAG: sigma-70 family RNA polymerase sigma factor [Acidobacteria bacterium]|nr:sigma-70 family RNA polymerase sigma factor [Acidobacteriota bacterium]
MSEREPERGDLIELVERAQNGDGEGYHVLYDLYSKPVYNFIFRLIGTIEDAEDLTQETFLKVFNEIAKLRDPGQFKYWLYRIARNEVYQRIRRFKRKTEVSIDDENIGYHDFLSNPARDINPEDCLLNQELEHHIRLALEAMPLKLREVFVLGVVQKFSYDEVTQIVGRSLLSVKTDIYRARLIAREKIGKYLDRTDDEMSRRRKRNS